MTNKDFIQEALAKFREEYVKAYREVFPQIVLEEGNPWFESFLTTHLTLTYEAGRADKAREIGKMIEDLPDAEIEYVTDGGKRNVKVTLKAKFTKDLKTKLEAMNIQEK